MVNPNVVFGVLNRQSQSLGLHILAVVVRLLLGVLLVYQSGVSRYPLAIEIIGWISIIAAAFLTVIGRDRFGRLISWALSVAKSFARVGGVLAACFGAFLIHAFI
jgi:hypothetical protein